MNLGKTPAVECFGSLRVALDVSSEYFWFPQRFMSMCFVLCFFPLSHCTCFIMLMRLSAILVSFHFTLLLFSSGIYLFNCRLSGTLQGFLPLSSQYFSYRSQSQRKAQEGPIPIKCLNSMSLMNKHQLLYPKQIISINNF